MLKAIILVVLIQTSSNSTPQYIIKFSSPERCEAARKEIDQPSGFYPLRRAYCVADLTDKSVYKTK